MINRNLFKPMQTKKTVLEPWHNLSSHCWGLGVKGEKIANWIQRKGRATRTRRGASSSQGLRWVPGYGRSSWFLSADASFPNQTQKGVHTQLSQSVLPNTRGPLAAALTLSACSLMGYRLFPCSWTWLHDAKAGFCLQCCLFPALFFTIAFSS